METGLRDEEIRREVFQAMQDGEPYARYVKTIKGKLAVRVLDPFRVIPTAVVLEGDPEEGITDKMIVSVWTLAEDKYLRANNKIHFERGDLVPYDPKKEDSRPFINQITDAEIEALLNNTASVLKSRLAQFTSDTPIRRILAKAEQMNRPVRTINLIKSFLEKFE